METSQLMQRFLIDMKCDHCEEGVMRSVLQIAATIYEHKCNNNACGKSAHYSKQYPHIVELPGDIAKINNSTNGK